MELCSLPRTEWSRDSPQAFGIPGLSLSAPVEESSGRLTRDDPYCALEVSSFSRWSEVREPAAAHPSLFLSRPLRSPSAASFLSLLFSSWFTLLFAWNKVHRTYDLASSKHSSIQYGSAKCMALCKHHSPSPESLIFWTELCVHWNTNLF